MGKAKEAAWAGIEALAGLFVRHAEDLWNHPEVSFQEERSSSAQRRLLRELGFHVTDLDSVQQHAFVAEAGSGAPIIGFLGEFDALPGLSQKVAPAPDPVVPGGPGHGCGHNLLGTALLAAAAGVKAALDAGVLRGTIRYVGCPAEEQLGKPVLAAAGVFGGHDALLSWHPASINTVAAYGTNASVELTFSFAGSPAHAAQAPHLGRSALDALTLMSVGVEFLREHMSPLARVHYIVTQGGLRPNIVPAAAEGRFQVRSSRMSEVLDLLRRVLDVARGAALMTGTRVTWKLEYGCYDVLPNAVMSDLLYENLRAVPLPSYTAEERALAAALSATASPEQKRTSMSMIGLDAASAAQVAAVSLHEGVGYWGKGWTIPASTDVGDASHIAPTAQINTATWPVGVDSHTWQATAASGSGIGAKGMLYAAHVLCGAACDLMADPAALAKARVEFRAATADEPYVPVAELLQRLEQT
jgi:aminobenzoyl-glutamate utilization protein B